LFWIYSMTYNINKMLLGLVLVFFSNMFAYAQTRHINIEWDSKVKGFPGDFKDAQSENISKDIYYPVWVFTEIKSYNLYEVLISNQIYETVNAPDNVINHLKNVAELSFFNAEERGKSRLKVKIVPFRVVNQRLERLLSFDLTLKQSGIVNNQLLKKKGNKSQSVLASGDWYKIKIKSDGVYKLDRAFFTKHGINPESINLSTFKIYGNGIGMLPEVLAEPRVDDLAENSIQIFDANANNSLEDGDYISFYGKGPSVWKENATDYSHVKNVFSDYSFYFFTFGGAPGKRVGENGEGNGIVPNMTITESDYLLAHDEDIVNFRNSGREWFGEALTVENRSFDLNIPDFIDGPGNFIRSEVAVRTAIPTNVLVYFNNSNILFSHYGSQVNFETDDNYASVSNLKSSFNSAGSFNLRYEFIRPQLSSEAWINYFEVQCKRKMKPIDGQIHLFNLNSKVNDKVEFKIENLGSDYKLWDVTDPVNITIQKTMLSGNVSSFIINPNGKLPRYLVFKNGSEMLPEMVGKVENQNLHASAPADFIIITHPDFKAQAEKLAKFHQEREGFTYLITYPDKIYNEFSSGALDITAIRDFVKMVYDRADSSKKPKALLLFGDASYDYRNLKVTSGNFVPTFESYESNNSISSYCSDDYYVILGDGEGFWPGKYIPTEGLDMGVGRLPAKSAYEAEVMVDKCIHYKTASDKGEWRSSITFLGDDEDYNTHIEDSEVLSDLVEKEFPPLNINKIYLDAYKQVSLGNGNAFPDVNEAINNSIAKGTLVFNYLGHGGGSGMAHERVVTRPQILAWKNYDKLVFFVTGTCNLAQFDNPSEESPGELMMTNDQGGAVGMITTTRKVYIGLNTRFAENLFNGNLFARDGNHFMTFGQSYINVKNIMWQAPNVRNYVMLGDPLLDLNLPVQKTLITKINGSYVQANSKDTLKALSKVEIEGMVTNLNGGLLTDFTGDVSITLFDKKQTYKTLANDPGSSVWPFSVRNNVLYRGKASVSGGIFKVAFILPKDIDYAYGTGRIFTYAYNDKTDAVGIYDSALVGGTANNLSVDNTGPQIEVFLDDEKFVNGGIVSKNPLLIVKLWDENGINTAGNGIGREILGVLDKERETKKNYVLNDFYSTTLNSYQGGEVRIRLADLTPGSHTLLVRAWDVFNNSSENQVEFVVAENENMAIRNLLNYPNPFMNKTSILFDHNKAGQELSVSINIMSIAGKVVKTIYSRIPNASSHISEIEWDGKDEFGQTLARGVYLYRVKVKSEDGKTAEEIQKMVLLK
jgi:hypothetical protein